MQKCINFRPFLYIFLATSVGALLGYAFLVQKLVTIIAVSAILLLFFIKLLTRYKVSVFQLWSSKAFSILLLVLFFASFFNFNIQFNSFEKEKLEGMIYAVEARIAQVSEKEDSFRFILEQVAVVEAGEATLLKQNLNLTVFDLVEEINPQIGDRVLFVGAVYDYKLLKNNELNTRAYFNNLGHYANASANEVSIISGEKHFDELLQEKVKTMLFKHLSYDNASLSYAVLFGDKNLLENNYYEQYTNSGIGHLLAVSGLHIGLLVALLVLLLSGLRVPKLWQGVILFLLLFGYSYLCGFTASVLRASIMALVFLLGHTIGERNDNLSNLMFAGTVILLLSPFYLFTVGFLLSFGSVLGIVLLYPLLCKWFYKIKLPVKLSQMLAVTIAVQIAILPIVAFYFKQTNVFSWVINLLAIPLFTVGYFGLFFATVLTGITSFFSFLFVVPNLLFTFLHLLAKFVSSVGVIELFSFSVSGMVFYYLGLFVVSQFVLLPAKQKWYVMSALMLLFTVTFVNGFLQDKYEFDSITKIDGVSSASVITTEQGKNYLVDVGVGDSWDAFHIKNYLIQKKIFTLDAIFLPNYNEEKQNTVSELCYKFNVSYVYLPDSSNNILKFNLISKLPITTQIVFMENEVIYTHNGLLISNYSSNEVGFLTKITLSSMQALFADASLNTQELGVIASQISLVTDVLVLNKMTLYVHNILAQNNNYNELNTIFASRNELPFKSDKVQDTITQGYLQLT